KEGVREAGGTPMELNTIAISDGITMGTSGMKTSLVSREVVADSIELVARGQLFDGVVALSGCDKTIPGTVMALARLDVPGVSLSIDDFDRIAEKTPQLCALKPTGPYLAVDLHEAGGIMLVAQRLAELGLLHTDALTVTGRTIGEHAAEATEAPGQQVVCSADDPIAPTGGLAILRGNLAPEGCVVKLAGHNARRHQRGPARVF